MRRTLTLVLVASWMALVALLVRKQGRGPALDPGALTAGAASERDEWFGVYQAHEKIGHAHRTTARIDGGYAFQEDAVFALAMLGVPQTLRTSLAVDTDAAFALRRFRFTLVSPATVFSASGISDDTALRVTYGAEGRSANLTLPLTEPIYLPSTLRPRVLAGDLTPGTRYDLPVLNPLTLTREPLTLTVEGRETVAGPDGPVETVRIAEEHQGVRVHAWLADDGAVVREESALGFTLERETKTRALAGADTRSPIDLTRASRIPLAGRIDDPRGATRLTLEVRGAAARTIPDDPPRQRVTDDRLRITREEAPGPMPLPLGNGAPPVSAEPFIESDDPAVVAQARAIVGDADDATVAARRLLAWVADHVEKAPTVTVPSARAVLASLRGDCNEHAVLLTALARAAGIPARVVAGAVYADDGFYYHAWTELWLGRWISADSVFGQLPVDATHVKLVAGGPEHHLALASFLGNLQFTVAED